MRNLCTLFHVLEEVLDTSERLLTAGNNLVRRENESVATRITKLNSVAVVSLDDIVGPVDARPRGLVDGAADGSVIEAGSVDGADGIDGTLGKGNKLIVLVRKGVTRVAVG